MRSDEITPAQADQIRAKIRPMPAKPGSWGRQFAFIALGVLLAALFVPTPGRFTAPWMRTSQDFVHVPLFATVAWTLRRVTSNRTILAAIIALAIAVGAELLQSFVGRSASLADIARGACGIAIFVGWNFAEQFSAGWRRRITKLTCLTIGAVLPLACAWPTLSDAMESWWEFPLLADFSSPWENRRWLAEGCRLNCKRARTAKALAFCNAKLVGRQVPRSSSFLFTAIGRLGDHCKSSSPWKVARCR